MPTWCGALRVEVDRALTEGTPRHGTAAGNTIRSRSALFDRSAYLVIRFLISAAIFLVTAALGLLIAGWLIDGVRLQPAGFTVAVVVFAVCQGVLGPFVFNMARRYASAVLGGIGLVTTLISLAIASLFEGGIQISGITAWVLASLVVWLVTALGGWILGAIFLKRRVEERKAR